MIPLVTNLLAYARGFRVAHHARYTRWKGNMAEYLHRVISLVLRRFWGVDEARSGAVAGALMPTEIRGESKVKALATLASLAEFPK